MENFIPYEKMNKKQKKEYNKKKRKFMPFNTVTRIAETGKKRERSQLKKEIERNIKESDF